MFQEDNLPYITRTTHLVQSCGPPSNHVTRNTTTMLTLECCCRRRHSKRSVLQPVLPEHALAFAMEYRPPAHGSATTDAELAGQQYPAWHTDVSPSAAQSSNVTLKLP